MKFATTFVLASAAIASAQGSNYTVSPTIPLPTHYPTYTPLPPVHNTTITIPGTSAITSTITTTGVTSGTTFTSTYTTTYCPPITFSTGTVYPPNPSSNGTAPISPPGPSDSSATNTPVGPTTTRLGEGAGASPTGPFQYTGGAGASSASLGLAVIGLAVACIL